MYIKKIFAVGLLTAIIVAILIIFSVTGQENDSNTEANRILRDGKNRVTTENSREKDVFLMKEGLKTALASMNSLPALQEDRDEEPRQLSKEVAELHKKTQDYYFAMAPEVLEEMLREQHKNDSWVAEIKEAAQETLGYEESQGTSLSEIDCRENLCKIKFLHKDLKQHDRFMDGRMDQGPWFSEAGRALGSYIVNDDSTIESFIYFTDHRGYETFLNMRRRMALQLDSV